MFSCEYCEISKNNFFIEHIWTICTNVIEPDTFTSTVTRLVFSRFFDIRGNLGMLKKNRLEKLVFPVKWSVWLYASTLQNYARRQFFDVNGVSIVISREKDVETGENMWKVLKTKAYYKTRNTGTQTDGTRTRSNGTAPEQSKHRGTAEHYDRALPMK